jgi:hypothetical protein
VLFVAPWDHINQTNALLIAGTGSMASPSESKAQTCGEDDVCQGAPETRLYLDLDKLPEVWVANSS